MTARLLLPVSEGRPRRDPDPAAPAGVDANRLEAITAELQRLVEAHGAALVSYWHEGTDMPLDRTLYSSEWLHLAVWLAPSAATHITVEPVEAS